MNLDQLKTQCLTFGLSLSDLQLQQYRQYLDLLQSWNAVMDLTAICQEEEMIEKHFYDCLQSARFYPYSHQNLLDVGSGAGFPGLVLKIAFPFLNITLLEPTGKRAKFLLAVIDELHLHGIEVINERAEDYIQKSRSSFEVVTARAVARLNILLELSMPFLETGGTFIALKGSHALDELDEAKNALLVLKGSLLTKNAYQLNDKITRYIILIRKETANDIKYPRAYGMIKKKPL